MALQQIRAAHGIGLSSTSLQVLTALVKKLQTFQVLRSRPFTTAGWVAVHRRLGRCHDRRLLGAALVALLVAVRGAVDQNSLGKHHV
eukprot:s44_g54.t1